MTITILGTIILPLLLLGIRWWLTGDSEHLSRVRNSDDRVFLSLGILLSLIGVPLLGLCAFHADQWRRGFRFLANRGVPPGYVWLSRQLIAFGPPALLLILPLAIFLVAPLLLPDPVPSGPLQWVRLSEFYAGPGLIGYYALTVFGYVVLGITVGQLTSMLLRSGFLAGVVSLLVTSLLAGWWWLMCLWGVNWLWSVLPIPAVLLLATRLRTRDWLLERNSLRAWLPPALVLLLPTAAILTAIPLYRVYSVPAIDPGFSLEQYDRPLTPEEQTTYHLYSLASVYLEYDEYNKLLAATDASAIRALEAAWVRRSREAIALGLEASERKYSPLVGSRLPIFQISVCRRVGDLQRDPTRRTGETGRGIRPVPGRAENLGAMQQLVSDRRATESLRSFQGRPDRDEGLRSLAVVGGTARPDARTNPCRRAPIGETCLRRSHLRRHQGRALLYSAFSLG